MLSHLPFGAFIEIRIDFSFVAAQREKNLFSQQGNAEERERRSWLVGKPS